MQQVRASSIPVVFGVGDDPVRVGLVASMNRPGGNATGVYTLGNELSGKYLSLLHDLVPKAVTIAALVEPRDVRRTTVLRDLRGAAAALGQKLLVLEAATAEGIDAQFARLTQEPADAMFVTVFIHSGGADRSARGTPSHPCNLHAARVCRSWRPHELWV